MLDERMKKLYGRLVKHNIIISRSNYRGYRIINTKEEGTDITPDKERMDVDSLLVVSKIFNAWHPQIS